MKRLQVYDGEGAELGMLTLEQARERYAQAIEVSGCLEVSGWDDPVGAGLQVAEVIARTDLVDDGSGNLGTVVRQAHREYPDDTLEELADRVSAIVAEAEVDVRGETAVVYDYATGDRLKGIASPDLIAQSEAAAPTGAVPAYCMDGVWVYCMPSRVELLRRTHGHKILTVWVSR